MALTQRSFTTTALLDHCVQPRAVLSATDANFCAKFLWTMHSPLVTNKFSIVSIYDHVFCKAAAPLLVSMTENETRSYARFMHVSLKNLTKMRWSRKMYSELVLDSWRGLIGFSKTWLYERGFLPPPSRTIGRLKGPNMPGDYSRIKKGVTQMTFDEFCVVMYKFQVELYKGIEAVLSMTDNKDAVRNAILTLKEMHGPFPAVTRLGNMIQDKIDAVTKSSEPNLRVLATSYSTMLGTAIKTMKPEYEYCPGLKKPAKPAAAAPAVSSSPKDAPNQRSEAPVRSSHNDSARRTPTKQSAARDTQRNVQPRSALTAAAAAAAASTSQTNTSRSGNSVDKKTAQDTAKSSSPQTGRGERTGARHHNDRGARYDQSPRTTTTDSTAHGTKRTRETTSTDETSKQPHDTKRERGAADRPSEPTQGTRRGRGTATRNDEVNQDSNRARATADRPTES
ncbi:THO2 plays a role in transcriptional elongation, partial [Linderina macrospora]